MSNTGVDIFLYFEQVDNPSPASFTLLLPSFPADKLQKYTTLDLTQSSAIFDQNPINPGQPFIVFNVNLAGAENMEMRRAEIYQLYYETFGWVFVQPYGKRSFGGMEDLKITRSFQVLHIAQECGIQALVSEIESTLNSYPGVPSITDARGIVTNFPEHRPNAHRPRSYLVERFAEAIANRRIPERAKAVATLKKTDAGIGQAVETALAVEKMDRMWL